MEKKIEIIKYILDEMYNELDLIGCFMTKEGQFVGPAINGDLTPSLRSQMIQLGSVFQQLAGFPKSIDELMIKTPDYKLVLQPIYLEESQPTIFMIVKVPGSLLYYHRDIKKYIKKICTFLE